MGFWILQIAKVKARTQGQTDHTFVCLPHGCGQNQWCHFGVGAPPILILAGIWMFTGANRDFDPWPRGSKICQSWGYFSSTRRPMIQEALWALRRIAVAASFGIVVESVLISGWCCGLRGLLSWVCCHAPCLTSLLARSGSSPYKPQDVCNLHYRPGLLAAEIEQFAHECGACAVFISNLPLSVLNVDSGRGRGFIAPERTFLAFTSQSVFVPKRWR